MAESILTNLKKKLRPTAEDLLGDLRLATHVLSPSQVPHLVRVCSKLGRMGERRALRPLRTIAQASMPNMSGGFNSLEEAVRAASEAREAFGRLQRAAHDAIRMIEAKTRRLQGR